MGNKILIIGGTGTVGGSLVKLLHSADANFVALARNEAKAKELKEAGVQTVMGELGDWPTIRNALQDIDAVFLLTNPSVEKVAMQNGLIDMAKEMGVRKIVKLSAIGAEAGSPVHLADWHGQIEDHLEDSGLDYVILRPHSFMQNMFMNLETIKNDNCFYESVGHSSIPMVDARDVAQASFDCLMTETFNNQTFTITGPTPISFEEMASALSSVTNRSITYIPIPSVAHNQGMKDAGVPEWLADDLTLMRKEWGKESINHPTSDFNQISNAKQFDVHQFAQDYADFFK